MKSKYDISDSDIILEAYQGDYYTDWACSHPIDFLNERKQNIAKAIDEVVQIFNYNPRHITTTKYFDGDDILYRKFTETLEKFLDEKNDKNLIKQKIEKYIPLLNKRIKDMLNPSQFVNYDPDDYKYGMPDNAKRTWDRNTKDWIENFNNKLQQLYLIVDDES